VIWGVFLIVGTMADLVIIPNMMSSVSDFIGSLQGKVMSGLPGNVQTSPSFTTSYAEMSLGINQLRSQLISTEQYMEMGSVVIGIVGVGFVTYGGLAKNNPKLKTDDTPLDILKKRLAKGEITKKDFNDLRQYIQ